MQVSDLKDMREWAARRIGAGQETPWDWYQLMKLREALEALIETEETQAKLRTEGLPKQAPHPETRHRSSVHTNPPDNVRRFPRATVSPEPK